MTKIIKFRCNVCHFEIQERRGYGMIWTGSFGKEDLEIVKLDGSENHICFNCFDKIQSVKVLESLVP